MRGDTPKRRRSSRGEIANRKDIGTAVRESEERFRAMADAAPVMIWVSDSSKLCTYFNQPWLDFVGRPLIKELGNGWAENVHQDDYDVCLQTYNNAFDERRSFTMEYRMRRHDGEYRWILDNGIPRVAADGSFAGYIGSCVDITDRKRKEEELRDLKDRADADVRALRELHDLSLQLTASTGFSQTYEKILDGLMQVHGADFGNIQVYNASTKELRIVAHRNFKPDFLDYFSVVHAEDSSACARALRTGESIFIEDVEQDPEFLPHRKVAAAAGFRAVLSMPVIAQHGEPLGIFSVHFREPQRLSDTALRRSDLFLSLAAETLRRKWAEESKRYSESRLAGIVESAMDAIVTIDSRQQVLVFNRAAEQMFGCTAREALGQTLDRFIPARFRELHKDHVLSFSETGIMARPMGATRPVSGIRVNGEEFPIEASISQVDIGGQKLFTVVMRDISSRWRAEEQIREQAALLEHAQDAIVVRDLQDQITYWNKSAERIFGWSAAEIVGKNGRELLHSVNPSHFDQAKQIVLGTGEWTGPLVLAGRDGREISVSSRWTLVRDAEGQPKSILIIDTDVTEKRKLEEQLFRAQRMESIGTLTGGIAHDLNNILSPIAMSVEMLRLKYVDEESRGWLKILQDSVERGGSMVQQVLSFARGNEGKRIEIQPRHLLVELVKILRDTFPKSIDVQFNLPRDLWTVTADPTQLHQILMNLCVNARDAMPHGGLLTLTAMNHIVDQNYARMNHDARIGEFVRLTVTDNGTGMDDEIVDRIFEPFFTTKPMGEGTGLGLSATLAIVQSHGGFLDVDSEIGRGTRMRVYLPASTDATPRSETDETVKRLPSGRGELVLVVDDEDSIRQITRSTLETFGYQVLTAGDGTEALALFAQHRDKIAVVITDMMMPFMDGIATIRALKRLRPNLKIISASGLAGERKMPESVRASVEVFLSKPYNAEMLLTSLSKVLAD